MTAEREFYDGEVVPGTRYRVIGLLGSGGMGSVYEVEHSELGKRFVLKALLRGLTNRDDLVRRLRNEWRALGQLEHVNIVGVTDAGVTTTGIPYFVMERLMGETLSSRLRRERRLRVSDALTIAADVLDGLSAAHSLGIVHRDVKPPNVFLVARRPAKLLDFGIAKMLDPKASQITGRGIAIGTPRYMSPEQTTGGQVDARSDLYSTGIILYEMIAGAGPFDHARDGNELFLAQLSLAPPPVSRFVPVPKELDATLLRLLAKKPADRPESAALVSAEFRALSKLLKNEPAAFAPPPDDTTVPGGPFDTLEGAATIPSDGAANAQAGEAAGVSLRPGSEHTLIGMPGQRSSSPAPADGATLRLAIVGEEAEGATTHTALPRPVPIVETPPPVEPGVPSVAPTSQLGAARPRRRALAVAAAIGACGIAATVVVAARRSPSDERVAPSSLAERVAAVEPALAPRPAPESPGANEREPAAGVTAAPPGASPSVAVPVDDPAPQASERAPAVAGARAGPPRAAPKPLARPVISVRAPSAKKQAKTIASAPPAPPAAPSEVATQKPSPEPQLPSSGL
jgi:serine/threonine-protein kinase